MLLTLLIICRYTQFQYTDPIPGYTGHRPELLNPNEKDQQQASDPRKHIPGYGGYVPGVKSENVFGKTYGKTSYASSAKSFPRGIDQAAHVKFQSVMKEQFIDHSEVAHLHETTAEIVGVQRGPDMYKKVSALARRSLHFSPFPLKQSTPSSDRRCPPT